MTTTTTTSTTASASALAVPSVQHRCADHVMNALSALTTDAASDDFLDALELAFAAEDRAMEQMRQRRRAERAARRSWSGASDAPANARQRST